MTKQEKIGGGIKFHLDSVYKAGLEENKCDTGFVRDIIISELHSQGVLIKVERGVDNEEVPCGVPCSKCVAVEPLI